MRRKKKKKPFPISEVEIGEITELVSTLRSVKKASERLPQADLTMSNADLALEVSDLQSTAFGTDFPFPV